ncbi:MAG: hypothetical protein LBD48_04360 [Treponema sp.]|jgi:hypothetical protein|nr:hypothetical protein [Treponema sp.]
MKRLVAVLLITLLAGSGSLWAADFWGFGNKGYSTIMNVSCIGIGGVLAAVPLFDEDMGKEPYKYYLWGAGGGFALLGLIGLLYDATSGGDSYAQAVEDNPILKHVSLGTTGEQTYVGVRFRF